MDSAVDSAIGSTNGIIAFRKWNENTSDVDLPIFEISSDDMPSMISTSIQVELKNAIKELEELTKDISQDPLFKYLEKSIDPFWNSIGKRSTGKYVREYYDILELDKQLNILNFKDVVLTFSPRFAQYLSEKDCYIMNLFLGATGITDKSKENEDEKFWNFISQNTKIEGLEYKSTTLDSYSDRWENIEKVLSSYNPKADLLINVEDYRGRLDIGNYNIELQFYDLTFVEPLLRGLNSLKDGGKALIQFSSLGRKIEADICYLYKYLFSTIAIIKPSTSSPTEYTHYLVANGFKINRYTKLKPEIDKILSKLNDISKEEIVDFTSLIENLDFEDTYAGDENDYQLEKISISKIGVLGEETEENDVGEIQLGKSKNFFSWIFDINNQIAIWVYSNVKAFSQAKIDFQNGYLESHSIFNFDDAVYRKALGLLGRTTYEALPKFDTKEIPIEIETSQIKLSPGFNLGENLILYIYLWIKFINPVSAFCLPLNLPPSKQATLKKEQEYSIREWLSILYYNGDLMKIVINPEIANTLLDKWTVKDLLDRIPDNSSLLSTPVDSFKTDMQKLLIETLINYKALLSDPATMDFLIKSINLKIVPLQNLRFKLSFIYGGLEYKMMKTTNISVIGEYELLNLTTSDERKQMSNYHQLYELTKTQFKERIFEHCCLPILFSGLKINREIGNESAVPELYFKYKPDAEAFASASNRYAPIWCSANEKDKLLGSQGNFFDEFSNKENPLFDKIKLMIAFPPINAKMLEITLQKCVAIIESRSIKSDLAIIIVYLNNSQSPDNGENRIDSMLNSKGSLIKFNFDKFEVDRYYDPYTGKIENTKNLRAIVLKTKNSSFVR